MDKYNFQRTNQGKRCKGRTPYSTFEQGVKLYKEIVFETEKEENDELDLQ